MEGTVQRIASQPRGNRGSLAYSVNVDGTWYGHGFKQPQFGQGAYISFEVTYNGQYANMDPASVQVLQPGQPPQQGQGQPSGAPPAQRQGGGAPRGGNANRGGMSKDDYWKNKEKRDVLVQKQIQWQASRNAAIEVVKAAISADALALPSKKADKMDALVALVGELTDQFNADVSALAQPRQQQRTMPQQEADTLAQAQQQAAQQPPMDDFEDDLPF